MNQEERMLKELPYKAWLDGLLDQQLAAKEKVRAFNLCPVADFEKQDRLIREILGKAGKNVHFIPPVYFDYGTHTTIGDDFFANTGCTILDVGMVKIGSRVMFGPHVSIYTAGHPVHPVPRSSGYEYGIAITIGDDVWIGGNTVINPGVTIGSGSVIGAGSVVTKDIPAGVIAAGNPCRVLREIKEQDKHYYYKDRKFDVPDYLDAEADS